MRRLQANGVAGADSPFWQESESGPVGDTLFDVPALAALLVELGMSLHEAAKVGNVSAVKRALRVERKFALLQCVNCCEQLPGARQRVVHPRRRAVASAVSSAPAGAAEWYANVPLQPRTGRP